MLDIIVEILRKIELHIKYENLCRSFSNFEKRSNLKAKEIEPYIRSHDQNFKYVARDKVFLKEVLYEKYTVRFFIGFQGGIVDFSYLVWKDGENENYYQGRLATLTELIDPQFDQKVKYKTPIATSLDDFSKILSEIFLLFEAFNGHFIEATKNRLIQ
jgi:hypothetical protein